VLEYPSDPGSINSNGDEYLFGPNMLVAPVVDEGVTSRPVYFPPGKWLDWDTGKEYVGPKTISVDAPQNRIPVAVRAGAIIPMAPLMQNTGAKPWDPITLEVYPSGTSTFTMYRDDGRTFAYRQGSYTVTRIDCNEEPTKVTLAIDESNKLFAPRAYVVRLHLANKPRSVSIDGAPDAESMWSWDGLSSTLTIKLASGSKCRHSVQVAMVGK
jgi:alpha-glucosidase